MCDIELYTRTCHAVTQAHACGVGEAELYLARLALLLMQQVGDMAKVQTALQAAPQAAPNAAPQAAPQAAAVQPSPTHP